MVTAISQNSVSTIKNLTTNSKVVQFALRYWHIMLPVSLMAAGAALYLTHHKNVEVIIPTYRETLQYGDIKEILSAARAKGPDELKQFYQTLNTLPLDLLNQKLALIAPSLTDAHSQEYVIAMQYLDFRPFDEHFAGKCTLDRLKRAIKNPAFVKLIDPELLNQRLKNRSYKTQSFTDDYELYRLLGHTFSTN